ncbi:hypothetical protein JQN58_04795 [Aneurinibacillus sp. BA2021]|nr:hypothetical protein [Aneurinibacillus sp. BA2021]
MIPLRYREVLPPYWYEVDIAERHFAVMEAEMDERQKKMDELRDQFILQRATYALEIWEWIYFRKVQSGSLSERREAIRKKRWAKRPFKLPVLRLIGSQYGNLLDVREDFLAKEIYFEYAASESIDLKRLYEDFEYIRPVHIKRAVPIARAEKTLLIKGESYNHSVDFPICGLEMLVDTTSSGQISNQSLSVGGQQHYHQVDMPITGFEVPTKEE